MGKTYKVDTSELDNCIKKINNLKEYLPYDTRPTFSDSKCKGAMKDEVEKVANDLDTIMTLYSVILTRTASCLTTFRNSVDSNDQTASRDVRK